ncbi:hypothetical protein RT717_09065 [Imperialibacter roseus]|uniref:Transposase n=1 Tax=Imperialibacter roseus TaxID=1324217 RepID=A0ABZ0IWL7_9BACT|nr:hypothetical protein [Imperialibacter roseus]WOK08784.1 hypothetical protein RT717_09065 [Imperialibacter roseus]
MPVNYLNKMGTETGKKSKLNSPSGNHYRMMLNQLQYQLNNFRKISSKIP